MKFDKETNAMMIINDDSFGDTEANDTRKTDEIYEKNVNIVKMQRFSTHDGPGVRTVVFMKGCPLRCEWCHNPETQSHENQVLFTENLCIGCGLCASVCENHAHRFQNAQTVLSNIQDGTHGGNSNNNDGNANDCNGNNNGGFEATHNRDFVHVFDTSLCTACLKCVGICPANALESAGKMISVGKIIKAVMRDYAFYGNNGGITLSGGEPMFQPDAALALLYAAKQNGINTAVETCGYFPKQYLKSLCDVTDFFLWDMKDGVSERHRRYTGVRNDGITENLLLADSFAKNILIRCIMVRGVNMDRENFDTVISVYHKMKHCAGVELIPYHAYGGSKAKQLGKPDNGVIEWIPSDAEMKSAAEYLRKHGVDALL